MTKNTIKKLSKHISVKLPPCKLYLRDVREIYSILKNNCEEVIIRTDKYEFNDISQLKDDESTEIHTLHLIGQNPHISVDLEPHWASIYVAEDSTLNIGILSQITGVLDKCKRKIARVFANPFSSSIILSLALLLSIFLAQLFVDGVVLKSLGGLLFALYILAYIITFRFSEHRYSTIILTESRGQNFFIRNKDQLLVNLIVAVISILLTILIMRIV